MGVLLDRRIYQLLSLWSAMLLVGLGLRTGRAWRDARAVHRSVGQRLNAARRRALLVLALAGLLTLILYLGYNLTFVQHQGRYLFVAIAPLSLAVAVAVRELLEPRTARVIAAGLLLAALVLLMHGIVRSVVPTLGLAIAVAGAGIFAAAGWLTGRWSRLAPMGLYAAFLALDLVCLYRFILPAL
jgi:hypothetical protein